MSKSTKLSFIGVTIRSAFWWASRREAGVGAGRVDQHEVGLGRASASAASNPAASARRRRARSGCGSCAPLAAIQRRAVGEEVRHRLLAQVQVEHRHARAVVQQGGARWMAMVDLPAPPFSLPTTMTRTPRPSDELKQRPGIVRAWWRTRHWPAPIVNAA